MDALGKLMRHGRLRVCGQALALWPERQEHVVALLASPVGFGPDQAEGGLELVHFIGPALSLGQGEEVCHQLDVAKLVVVHIVDVSKLDQDINDVLVLLFVMVGHHAEDIRGVVDALLHHVGFFVAQALVDPALSGLQYGVIEVSRGVLVCLVGALLEDKAAEGLRDGPALTVEQREEPCLLVQALERVNL